MTAHVLVALVLLSQPLVVPSTESRRLQSYVLARAQMAPHLIPVAFEGAGTLRRQSACEPGHLHSNRQRPTPDPLYDGTAKDRTPGLSNPVLLKGVKPTYTTDAFRQKIEGEAMLLARVEADGTVVYAEIDCSLDSIHGLDAQALKAAKQWVFSPARLNGRPVAFVVTIEMSFRMGPTPPGHEV